MAAGCGGGSRGPAASGPLAEKVGGDAASPESIAPASASPGLAGSNPIASVTGNTYAVNMTEERKFSPLSLTVPTGAVVRFFNPSGVPHTATADPARASDRSLIELPSGAQPWDSGQVQPGGDFQMTFRTPGTYRYICTFHVGAGMVGTIVVSP